MKRLCIILMLLTGLCASAAEKSRTIVYINGAKYYIHTVQPGETIYGLSKLYGVGEKVILENNPALIGGLKSNENIRIPVVVFRATTAGRTASCARRSISIMLRRARRSTPSPESMRSPYRRSSRITRVSTPRICGWMSGC